MIRPAAAALLIAAAGTPASAVGMAEAPPGAASCSGCHARNASATSLVPVIAGRPADEIVAAMAAFRSGTRPATVMNRIAPGFSEGESRAIAVWLAGQTPPR